MKKYILLLVLVFAVSITNAQQFYVSASGGYSVASAGVKFGTKTTTNGVENTYGSYGEGIHTQIRGGYFFNNTFGVEVGFGYLSGADQTSLLIDLPSQAQYINIEARGKAYGASASFVYKFTNNIYGRFGALIKIGGKTESDGKINIALSPSEILNVDYTQDYKGRLPLGFIGAVGYKYDISKKISLFAEFEYMGISITRDSSEITAFSANVNGASRSIEEVKAIFAAHPNYSALSAIFNENIEYVDELPIGADQTGRKQLSQKVPYSSFGINIGATFYF